ncbi:flavin-containing monooxygenase [Sphingobium xenophagum]|uniref:flavin-containing monooxygenase n=1 Tax=Sphingobium xenophagum TaxID=121428 RepID=UPI0003799011|nr:NAD(P)/FAD-dependent oxidoreductase [Sphingobium xenophagum]
MSTSQAQPAASTHSDVIVVGGGFSGIYAVHKFRNEMGLSVQAFEAGSGVGGTWYWNRYPGARCDFESIYYSYSFSKELQQEWVWKERFAPQSEILAYLEHVAERFDVKRSFAFDTRVIAMVWDEDAALWHVTTDRGQTHSARFVISGAGNLSLPKEGEFPGADKFGGQIYMTGRWPHEGVDFSGKRVAVIGTGSSGIQAIPLIAEQADHLTVFQRTANFAAPLRNAPMSDEELAEVRKRYTELRVASRKNFSGVPYPDALPATFGVSEDERREVYQRCWDDGGFRMLLSSFQDLLVDPAANAAASDYIRAQISRHVVDPKLAQLLTPTDHAYGTKRPAFETGYYDTFNRPNVDLVDLRSNPIDSFYEKGIRTRDGDLEFDAIVLATGFDAMTGPLLNMGIVGRNGLTLKERWQDGPNTYLGIASDGFPNLFMITGPQSAVALYNNPLAIEDHVDYASGLIKFMGDHGYDVVDPSPEAVAWWGDHVQEVANHTLFSDAKSWYTGANVPGKPQVCMIYVGGAPTYRKICDDIAADGYRGFTLEHLAQTAIAS